MEQNLKHYDPDRDIVHLLKETRKINEIEPSEFRKYDVKRGLRNADGTGVIAGITRICNVHGYVLNEGDKSPVEGRLTYRGIDVFDLVDGFQADNRFGFEETAWLLLYGQLPTSHQLDVFNEQLASERELPDEFIDDIIIKCPSENVMNTLQRSTLALYSHDENAEDQGLDNVIRQSISLLAKMPILMTAAYQVRRRTYDRKSMYFHIPKPEFSIAENILRGLRSNKQYTDQEAKMLDLCLVLHAEHGGGNNSTFVTSTLTSSGTDTYSAIAGGIGSLKGFRHGGANQKVMQMINSIKDNVSNWEDEVEVSGFLKKIINKEANDGSGLIYGMGHAVYTISDPRAIMLKKFAEEMIAGTEFEKEYRLINLIEKLSPDIFNEKKGTDVPLCANVDLYSGMVYSMLGIPPELMTPMFAVARTAGWCAHRMEEITTAGGKIIRPAYKSIAPRGSYIPISER